MKTGTLDVVLPTEIKTFEWNGDVKDRQAAREAFEGMMRDGYYLAVVSDGPKKAHQVRTFDEIEEVERERGTVTARISTALVGG